MADASQLEADLLAALGASMPELETSGATETDTDTIQHPPQPPQDALPESSSAAPAPTTSSPTIPPPPTHPAAPPAPAQAPASAPIPTAVAPLPTPRPSAPETIPAPESSSKISSPRPTQLAQPLAPSQIDGALLQSLQATPVSTSQNGPGLRSPKRPRSPDGLDESIIKRQKMDQTGQKEATVEAPNLDLAAMLNDALANFDQHDLPESDDIIMPDVDMPQPAAPASATPEPEKAENKIMKASSNPFYVMRSMSLPVLGNIAVQILLRLSQQPRAETQSLLADSESEFRKAYDMLRDIFRPTRKAFSDSPLLSPDELDITDSEDRETIRMSNLAATAASVFGAQDVPLEDVHDAFFSIFIPEDGEYKASLAEPLVCLKTRLFLDALDKTGQAPPDSQLLDTLFPVNFDESLRLRSGDLLLSTEEDGLVSQIKERRELLVKSLGDESSKKSLNDQSTAEKFAESLSIFLQSHLGVVVDYAEKYGVNIPLNEEEAAPTRDADSVQQEEHDSLAALLQSATSHLTETEADAAQMKDILSEALASAPQVSGEDDSLDLKKLIEQSLSSHIPDLKESSADQLTSNGLSDFDSKNLASLISEKLKSDLDIPSHGLPNLSTPPPGLNTATHPQYLSQLNHTHPSPYQSYAQGSTPPAPVGANGENLPPNQSMPTAALYEKARQAAVAKSSNTTRREGLHSTRRPWTPEEEKALMAGLDMVKGPHWSQILSLFGQHGTISDILKDRTQVQLKDKARNLKLFFLKTNSEMPYYLQSVTGELKTRAPSQAARKEAEEKARLNLEEEQARIQGIMTLAGGLQNNHHPANSPLAPSPVKRTSPIVGVSGGTATNPSQGTASNSTLPQVPISPRVKIEPSDHHHPHHKVTAFPPIQPAPSVSAVQQALKSHLPALQPQPGLQHQQPKPPQQQQYQQSQQPRQEPPKAPQQQQQHRQPLPQHQPHAQPQSMSHSLPTKPQQHQHQHQPQTQPRPPSQPQQQQQQQQPRILSPTAANTANTKTQAQVQAQTQQAFPLPPIPPNHHSTPDHAQDTKLFETLQAAIAASSASEGAGAGGHAAVAAVLEGSGS